MDIKTFKNNVLKAIDKLAIKIHKKIVGPKESITIYFTADSKESLEYDNFIYAKNEVVVEIPKKATDINMNDPEYWNINCKFKIGDGVSKYTDLKYHIGTIPPVIEQTLNDEYWIF